MKIIPFPLKKQRLSVKKLYDDLDYWIFIGIGDDIVEIPSQRREYARLVKKHKYLYTNTVSQSVPKLVLQDLKQELQKPFFLQKTFYWLLWLEFRKLFS